MFLKKVISVPADDQELTVSWWFADIPTFLYWQDQLS